MECNCVPNLRSEKSSAVQVTMSPEFCMIFCHFRAILSTIYERILLGLRPKVLGGIGTECTVESQSWQLTYPGPDFAYTVVRPLNYDPIYNTGLTANVH
jgi:hypothetical protein